MGFSSGHFTTDSSGGGTGTGDKIQTIPSSYVAAITAGENLTIRDAVCLDLDGSGDYRVYKADYTLPNRRNACGFATATVSTGAAVTIHRDGPLGGFSGLTRGTLLYVGNTAGAVTTVPTDTNPVLIGQAVGVDTVWAFPISRPFATPNIFVVSHGSTTLLPGAGTGTAASYNYTSWAALTADGTLGQSGPQGESVLNTNHVYVDGTNTGGTVVAVNRIFNKTAWSSGATRTTQREDSGNATMSSLLYSACGYGPAAYQNTIDSWNGSSWNNAITTVTTARYAMGSFYQGGTCHFAGGYGNGAAKNDHDSFNGSTVSALTVAPATAPFLNGSISTGSSGIMCGQSDGSTASYKWAGGSWSASITATYALNVQSASANPCGGASGFSGTISLCAGGNVGGAATLLAQQFNGTSWTATTSMSTAKSGLSGGCY
jgi:hypothetical protein